MSEPPTSEMDARKEAPPSFWRVLLAPWMYVGTPSKAAAVMAKARWPAAAVAYLLPVLAFGAAIIFLVVWDATVELAWREQGHRLIERSFSDVWHAWHEHGIGWVELLFASLVAFVPMLSSFVAWLLLPSVHRGGSVWRSYARAFRGAAAGAGLLTGLTFAVGAIAVFLSNARDREIAAKRFSPPPVMLLSVGTGAFAFLTFWVSRAIGSLGDKTPAIEVPPRCEGCGYDLRHRPTDGRCPECGLSSDSSLVPGVRRPGSRWENERRGPLTWLSTVRCVVFTPSQFYGALKLRTPMDKPQAFARWNYGLIGAGSLPFAAVLLMASRNADDLLSLALLTMFLSLIIAWGLHHPLGALATSWWVMRGALPDYGWAGKVIAYESAYLWAFCLYNGVFSAAMTVNDRWLMDLFAGFTGLAYKPFGMLFEELVVIGGNAALLLLWLWRYHLAARAIRWSNY
jgi:hypothetical protein